MSAVSKRTEISKRDKESPEKARWKSWVSEEPSWLESGRSTGKIALGLGLGEDFWEV